MFIALPQSAGLSLRTALRLSESSKHRKYSESCTLRRRRRSPKTDERSNGKTLVSIRRFGHMIVGVDEGSFCIAGRRVVVAVRHAPNGGTILRL